MILRRYGTTVQSVEPHFDSLALTEIGFRRNGELSLSADQFAAGYEKVSETSLAPEVDGTVQTEVEQALLAQLANGIRAMEAELVPGQVLLVESEHGIDFPKMREKREGVIIEGENRLHFHWWVEPPLRLGVYRRADM